MPNLALRCAIAEHRDAAVMGMLPTAAEAAAAAATAAAATAAAATLVPVAQLEDLELDAPLPNSPGAVVPGAWRGVRVAAWRGAAGRAAAAALALVRARSVHPALARPIAAVAQEDLILFAVPDIGAPPSLDLAAPTSGAAAATLAPGEVLSLAAALERLRPPPASGRPALPLATAFAVGHQLCEALETVATAGLVHGFVHPAAVLALALDPADPAVTDIRVRGGAGSPTHTQQ